MAFNVAMKYDSTPNSYLAANHTLYKPVKVSQAKIITCVLKRPSIGFPKVLKLAWAELPPSPNTQLFAVSNFNAYDMT